MTDITPRELPAIYDLSPEDQLRQIGLNYARLAELGWRPVSDADMDCIGEPNFDVMYAQHSMALLAIASNDTADAEELRQMAKRALFRKPSGGLEPTTNIRKTGEEDKA